MKNNLLHKIIRILGVVIGLLFILLPIWLFFAENTNEILWVQPILGILFLVYGLGDYKALSKILPSYKKHIKNEKNV